MMSAHAAAVSHHLSTHLPTDLPTQVRQELH